MADLDAATRNALPDSAFAYIDSNGTRHLPIHDAAHVRDALARLNQVSGLSGTHKIRALAKIKRAAGKFGIDARKAAEVLNYAEALGFDFAGDEADDDTVNRADEGAPAPGMTPADVHVDGPVNAEATKKKKSKSLRNLTRAVRAHFASGRLLSAESFDRMYRQSIGSQGGTSRKSGEDMCDECDCDDCTGPGCGCCDACEPEEKTYVEGDAHFTAQDGTKLRLYIEQSFSDTVAGADRWVQYLPKPGIWDSPRYGKIEITRERNARFVKNFNEGVYQDRIPIDAEHETKLSGALGWIQQGEMRQEADGSVRAYARWTDRGRSMLTEERFKYFSPEWYDSWKDPATSKSIIDVAIGGALTTRPFFKPSSLQPVIAGEQGFKEVDENNTQESPTMAGEEKTETGTDESTRLTELETRNAELETQLAESKKAREDEASASKVLAESSKQLAERIAKIEAEDRRRAFTEQAREFPGETAKHVALMERVAEDETALAAYVEIQKAAAEQIKAAGLFGAIGSSAAQANGEVDSVAQARKAAEAIVSGGKDTTKAKAAAEAWTPELYEQYLNEQAGR